MTNEETHQLNPGSGSVEALPTAEPRSIDPKVHAEIVAISNRYGITYAEAEIAHERQKVYGDPKVNHDGIAQAWAGLLQPYSLDIAMMRPIPAHVVALMMAALKMNRMRMVHHEDNFDDLNVYMAFARTWSKEAETGRTVVIGPRPSPNHRLVLKWEEAVE